MSLSVSERIVKPGMLYELAGDGKWDMFFDHHMISGFGKCEAYFELKHIQHINRKGEGNFKMFLGQWWSRCMELYYTALATDPELLTRIHAIDLAIEAWQDCKIDEKEKQFPSSYETFGGKAGAIGMMNQYYDFSYQYDKQFWKIVSIESGFGRQREVLIGENDKVRVFYIGKPDLMIIEQGRVIPLDHKTKDSITPELSNQFKPHAQTAGYLVAGQAISDALGLNFPRLDRVIINVAARNEPTDNPRNGKARKPRFLRIPVSYSQQELEEWRFQTVLKASRLRECIETGNWMWNDNACHIYGGCEMRNIHASPLGVRPLIIQSHYTITEPWVPYVPDED